ncbi:MAG: 3-deoxy-D-manno-octulosonic acid transferase [bacterium]
MFRVASLFYSFLYTIAIFFYGPVRILQAAVRKQKLGVLGRLGKLPEFLPTDRRVRTVWVHAVSVGEVNAAGPLIKCLAKVDVQIFLSTTTGTGQEHATRLFGNIAQVFYFPLDWQVICRRYLKRIRPAVVLLVETEIWPNFILAARDLGIPLALVNGRISDRSFRRYVKARFLVQPLLGSFAQFCMQSQQDLKRIRRLGAPKDRTSCTGNLKFDYIAAADSRNEHLKQVVSNLLKPDPGDLLLICGSTRSGEEELILSSLRNLRKEFPDLKLLIAPRHPHRGAEVREMLRDGGFRFVQRSRDNLETTEKGSADVLILDSIGELASMYEIADLVFIGGSLVPKGGQNIIEAAACGKPILFGPHMDNFRQVAHSFKEAGAAIQLSASSELEAELRRLLQNPEKMNQLGQRATTVIEQNRGALKRTIAVIEPFLRDRNRGK